MNIKKTLVLGGIISLLLAGGIWLSHPSSKVEEPDTQLSWGQWLIGRSGSVQMHFLDLLELLTRQEHSGVQVKK
ncbi:hypothetical protein [Gallaecimonas mangrovi]|uniref:hypothetical protein n=1 Tax=Gallaecimonas mangrovi TaxID=2291597 RepID=UPI000E201661|nr:hypothetical protein [Gallaecimonas mangrovi]